MILTLGRQDSLHNSWHLVASPLQYTCKYFFLNLLTPIGVFAPMYTETQSLNPTFCTQDRNKHKRHSSFCAHLDLAFVQNLPRLKCSHTSRLGSCGSHTDTHFENWQPKSATTKICLHPKKRLCLQPKPTQSNLNEAIKIKKINQIQTQFSPIILS